MWHLGIKIFYGSENNYNPNSYFWDPPGGKDGKEFTAGLPAPNLFFPSQQPTIDEKREMPSLKSSPPYLNS